MPVRIRHALFPNLVDVAGERLLRHVLATKLLRNAIDFSLFLRIVVGNGDGFLVGVQNDLHVFFSLHFVQ